MKDSQYFATLKPDEFVPHALGLVDEFYDYLQRTGILAKWRRVWRAYHGARIDQSDVGENLFSLQDLQDHGDQGELTYLQVNHFRNILQHVLQLTTAQRPAFDARPINSDFRSQSQAILGNGILEYYLREKDLEEFLKRAVEHALMWGEGHVSLSWDPNLGEPFMASPEGKVIKEGDIRYWNPTPLDVIRDVTSQDPQRDWVIVRTWKNKYDLAAKHPEKAEAILNISDDRTRNFKSNFSKQTDQVKVPVYIFMHEKTESVPTGRYMEFAAPDVVLVDGGLPYREIPLFSIMPSRMEGTQFGYTAAFDGLPIQQAINVQSSIILSNQKTFGVQNLWCKPGNNITVSQLADGMNLLESTDKPEALALTSTAPEIFSFRTTLIGDLETIFGVNSVVRGNPEASLKSGSALALVVSQAVQFNSGLQQAYNSLLESVGTNTLMLLRDYAKTKRVASILGKNSRPFQKEFSGSDLDQVNRVVVEQASAVSKTSAGRLEIANNLLQTGLIKTADEYLMVVQTGKLEPLIEAQTNELLLIRSENEELREGRSVQAILTENHPLHIQEHMSVLSNPESKRNPQLVAIVLAHIQEHIELWKTMDPALLQLLKMPAAPQGIQIQPPPQAQGAPGLPAVMNQESPAQMPSQPNMPSPPPNAPPQAEQQLQQALPPQ